MGFEESRMYGRKGEEEGYREGIAGRGAACVKKMELFRRFDSLPGSFRPRFQ